MAFVRLIVRFLTRPIRLATLARALRPKGSERNALAEDSDSELFAQTRLIARWDEDGANDRWLDTRAAVVVTEQPLDTLPDELRDELLSAPRFKRSDS